MSERTKVTVQRLQEMKQKGEKITMITAYDYPTGVFVDQAGMDIVLVGDSLGMTLLGWNTTLPVTMEDMIPHARAVVRGCKSGFVLGDMPYMTYQPSIADAVRNAGRFMAEAATDGIKLEGGIAVADRVEAIVKSGIPVMGHLGLTPQSMSALGGFKAQARGAATAKRLYDDCMALQDAGAFSILLECVPARVAGVIARKCEIPIISIGAGVECDGQLLIFHDCFGLYPNFTPKFAKVYGNAGEVILNGLRTYVDEVQRGAFPEPKHSFSIPEDEFRQFEEMVK
ncbi:MAG: 3-methyl-2-oxobutanoate hydroxymethyltransferase [Bacteroidetes bacterium]|nr:3-methyl-2-oxobutanoate hydroxymethyltransferase [Bacteroidota bacterium]MCL5027227.1 3-methyl-2-oxobutanoate hydroxymethyltransferase [Chloroflexota bacterium]